MCLSISLKLEKSKLEKRYNVKFKNNIDFTPFYFKSAFEDSHIPVITNENNSTIKPMQWGLIPHWIKNNTQALEIRSKTYNARVENIFDKPSFKYASPTNRCIIPVSGFFEWQLVKGKKIPWFVYPKNDETFSIAGIWNSWIDPSSGEIHNTFTIITVPANNLMSKIHNTKKRMPAIVCREMESEWLSTTLPQTKYAQILLPYSDLNMEAYTVSPITSNVRENRNISEIIEPYIYQFPEQKSLF